MSTKYLDYSGLSYFWSKLKNYLATTTHSGLMSAADKTKVDMITTDGTIAFYRKEESVYVTETANENTIPIGISGFTTADMLLVDINGLDLSEGDEYVINGTNIVLDTPIGTIGTVVHFVVLRAITATAADVATLKGEKGDDGVVQDVLQNGVSVLGQDGIARVATGDPKNVWYGTCSTGASTQAKVATTSSGDFALTAGNMVRIKFDNAQTYNGTATLNVDGTGAKDIARVGTTKTTRYYWTAGEVVDFVYDGTNFVMSAKGTATTSYYGLTKLSSSVTSTSTELAATPSAVKQAYDLAKSATDVDYVIEQGTSGIWEYRTWSSGKAECWAKSTQTRSSSTTNVRLSLPFTFDSSKFIGIQASGGATGYTDAYVMYTDCYPTEADIYIKANGGSQVWVNVYIYGTLA